VVVAAEPVYAVKDLGWTDSLALAAEREGRVDVECNGESVSLESVTPARLDVRLDDSSPTALSVHTPFRVRARLYDRRGRELEVGKLTRFEWSPSGVLTIANDGSSGEFGVCDTCYGMHQFRAVRAGRGSIEARFGGLKAVLQVEAMMEKGRRR
jgi:hypothetical protein